MSAFAVEEVLRPSSGMACDGFWSGTEERQHQPYIAMIPECRYLDQSEIVNAILHEHFPAPKAYVPVSYPAPQLVDFGRVEYAPPKPKRVRRSPAYYPAIRSFYHTTIKVDGIMVPLHMSGATWDDIVLWARSGVDLQRTMDIAYIWGWNTVWEWVKQRAYRVDPKTSPAEWSGR